MNKAANPQDWLKFFSILDEAKKRQFAAIMAKELGWGGITTVSNITGMSISTIRKGIKEIESADPLTPATRIRKVGGGRKKITTNNPKILLDLEGIMAENTLGDPMSLLRWSIKSTYTIADELERLGHTISAETVRRILLDQHYSLQANVKSNEGGVGPDRDAQFHYINKQVKQFTLDQDPVISVDAKKRELVGEFKNAGRTWRKSGDPKNVNVFDFRSHAIGIAIPYGTYDVQRNEGFVNVGVSRDTSEFAVESIQQWWNLIGNEYYPNARKLLICADGGGSNGSRRRGWKYFLQKFSDKIQLPITVSHLPPGTSKWNKIEHRMFSFISINWKGTPLADYETIIKLIGSTRTRKGLTVVARLDEREYEGGRKVSDEEMAKIRLERHELHPKWNYTVEPRNGQES